MAEKAHMAQQNTSGYHVSNATDSRYTFATLLAHKTCTALVHMTNSFCANTLNWLTWLTILFWTTILAGTQNQGTRLWSVRDYCCLQDIL